MLVKDSGKGVFHRRRSCLSLPGAHPSQPQTPPLKSCVYTGLSCPTKSFCVNYGERELIFLLCFWKREAIVSVDEQLVSLKIVFFLSYFSSLFLESLQRMDSQLEGG